MTVEWLLIDAMGVIFIEGRDLYELLIPFVKNRKPLLSDKLIQRTYLEASMGKITSQDVWIRLGFETEYPGIEKEYLDSCLTIDPDFFDIAKELKKTYSIALISNDVKEWSLYLRDKFGLNQFFDIIIISGEVGIRKPDISIFNLLLSKIKALPGQCIFVDDNLNNLRTASELGIKTIRFVRAKTKTSFCSEFEISSFNELKHVIESFF